MTGRVGTAMRRARRVWPAAVLLAAGMAAFGSAAPAAAAGGSITSPAKDGIVFSKNQLIQITSDASGTTSRLQLTAPGGSAPQTVDADAGRLGYDFYTACYPGSGCTDHPAINGTWTVELTGAAQDTRTFVLQIPPAAPQGVTAAPAAPGQVSVHWQRGVEPDLVGYLVSEGGDGSGGGPSRDVAVADACDASGACSAVLQFTGSGYAGEHSFVVAARRSAGPGSGATLLGPPSRPAQASVTEPPPPPPPSPKPTPPGGGSPGTGPNGSLGGSPAPGGSSGSPVPATGGGTGRAGGSGTTTFGTGSGSADFGTARLGITEHQVAPPQPLPSVASTKLPDGTYQPTLGYQDKAERVPVRVPDGAASATLRGAASVVDDGGVWRGVAAALVLVLLAAHLRRWTSRPVD